MKVSVVTPEKIAQERQADAVYVPAWDGEMGILQNHLPVLAELKAGEVRIQAGEQTDSFAISGGFIEVRDNQVSIFAETAEAASDIDIERARQAAERAKAALRASQGSPDLAETEAALRRALIRLHVAENIHRRRSHR